MENKTFNRKRLMFILSLKLLLKGEETATADSGSKGSSVTVQTKKIKFLQCIKYVINAELLRLP